MIQYRELKQRVSIEQVLAHYKVRTTKKGSQHVAECPFCTGTFKASFEKNCFICFSCGAKGNILDFVAKKENMPIKDAACSIFATFIEKPQSVKVPIFARIKAVFTG
jgi:DNA primase